MTTLRRAFVAVGRMGERTGARARGLGRATTSLGGVGLQCGGGRGLGVSGWPIRGRVRGQGLSIIEYSSVIGSCCHIPNPSLLRKL